MWQVRIPNTRPLNRLLSPRTTFANCINGNVAILVAVMLPMLALGVGGSIDFARLVSVKNRMQDAADAAAMASVRMIGIAQADSDAVEAVAKNYVAAHSDSEVATSAVNVNADMDARSVTVTLILKPKVFFATAFLDNELNTRATAEVVGQLPLCVLGLEDSALGTITLQNSAELTGNDCAVYSNSKQVNSITVSFGGKLTAGTVCSAGGGSGNIDPYLVRDCPVLDDPLSLRSAPSTAGDSCDETDLAIGMSRDLRTTQLGQDTSTTVETLPDTLGIDASPTGIIPIEDLTPSPSGFVRLYPGVYCGGIVIGGEMEVQFEPGIYIIKDGPLHIDERAAVTGEYVGFYFTGSNATLYFGPRTSISLSAPKDGELAGILLFEDRAAPAGRSFSILSDDARTLTGTVYLPRGTLTVDADQPVADKSAYTAIISRRMTLYAGPHLVLNTDYDMTDVPVAVDVDYNGSIRLTN